MGYNKWYEHQIMKMELYEDFIYLTDKSQNEIVDRDISV